MDDLCVTPVLTAGYDAFDAAWTDEADGRHSSGGGVAGTGKRMRSGMGETMEAGDGGCKRSFIYFIHPCFEGGGTTRWMQRWRQRGEDGNRRGGA